MQTLDLGFNAISDATALSNMGSLRELHLDANQVTTLGTALNNKPALTKLYRTTTNWRHCPPCLPA
ncbi:MAG: hypothetical protein HZT40_02475 [Candidatus Thiothrix singaporensis]|uniref:Leucine-rich repeat domain-containing protein n=1 Tax=Candidatus Thiothrix singaporensis TaxID=2799669 RepID=A0A7L6ANJ3_9GAMM|nr:MAG: hypothetical protein HZT40_02475 [Candidatus Thiothrix singaporensis]